MILVTTVSRQALDLTLSHVQQTRMTHLQQKTFEIIVEKEETAYEKQFVILLQRV